MNLKNIPGSRHLFSKNEDNLIKKLVENFGDHDWKMIAMYLPNRTPRQIRERYKNYLAPDLKNGKWTKEEDELLKQKVNEFGQKWSLIAPFFPTRSDVNIKNHWSTLHGKMNKNIKVTVIPPQMKQPSITPLPMIKTPSENAAKLVMPILYINKVDFDLDNFELITPSIIHNEYDSFYDFNDSTFMDDLNMF